MHITLSWTSPPQTLFFFFFFLGGGIFFPSMKFSISFLTLGCTMQNKVKCMHVCLWGCVWSIYLCNPSSVSWMQHKVNYYMETYRFELCFPSKLVCHTKGIITI